MGASERVDRVRSLLDAIAHESLAGAVDVIETRTRSGAVFRVTGSVGGADVEVGYEWEVHLWLQVGTTWRVDAQEDLLDDILDEWRGLTGLAKRIATGVEVLPDGPDCEAWVSSNGVGLQRIEQRRWPWRGR